MTHTTSWNKNTSNKLWNRRVYLKTYTMIPFKFAVQRINYLILLVIASGLIVSCKKDSKLNVEPYVVQAEVRDSAYLKIKDIYLWTELLPSIQEFRPRDSKDIYEVMNKVRTYQPLDRFSFVETKEETERASQGLESDFGFLVKFYSSLTDLRVNYVYEASPGGNKGVKRGWKILKLNGRELDGAKQEDKSTLKISSLGL